MTEERVEQFVVELTAVQPRLYAYIVSLTGDQSRARDILQETNLVLWRKVEEFTLGTNFAGWACKVAHYRVLAARRDSAREKVFFSSELLDCLACDLAGRAERFDGRREALQVCLAKLPDRQRDLISRRYTEGLSLRSIAKTLGRTADSVATSLLRIRVALQQCVKRREAMERG